MSDAVPRLLAFLQSLPPEAVWAVTLLSCFGSVVGLHRAFGEAGLQAWVLVAILAANVQVLKVVQFGVLPEPVALGTVLFSSSYLATDVLAEVYGARAARRAVLIGFAGYLAFTLQMLLTLGYRPLPASEGASGWGWAARNHEHLAAIFGPSPALFTAGMAAYLTSQLNDVWLFDRLRRASGGRWLWLRNNVSTAVSALIDNTVFSLLAWIVLASDPLPLRTVAVTYILGTYVLRLVVALLDTPFVYLARRWAPPPATP